MLPHIVGNVGFVFTNEDLGEIRNILLGNKKEAPAKAGAIAPLDVFVPSVNTGMGPEKTSFFQALAIPTKITRGTIEILRDIHLIKEGEKVMYKMQCIIKSVFTIAYFILFLISYSYFKEEKITKINRTIGLFSNISGIISNSG